VLIEKQSNHRQELEKRVIETQSKVTTRGQLIALFLVVVLTSVAFYFGYTGQVALSGTIFATTIVSVATAFIVGREAQQRSLVRKSPK
jgi:heme/copper-type cytochrome/quinol oxidase subunit 4